MPPRKKPSKKPPQPPRDGLNGKQRLFVDAYLGAARGNATEAARLAGYTKATAAARASEILRNPKVHAEIERRFKSSAMSADEIISRLSEEAAADLRDFFDLSGEFPKLDLKKALESGKTHLIKSISCTVHGYKVELHDSQAAKALLARYHGLFVDRHKHEFERLSDEELIARATSALGGSDPARSGASGR